MMIKKKYSFSSTCIHIRSRCDTRDSATIPTSLFSLERENQSTTTVYTPLIDFLRFIAFLDNFGLSSIFLSLFRLIICKLCDDLSVCVCALFSLASLHRLSTILFWN